MRNLETGVLVVGAGPVGLVLAMSLARLGVDVTVVEQRPAGEPPSVKCNHVAARSMEIFRRLGVVAAVREAGLPADYAHDVTYRTTFTGREITRIPIPCRRDRFTSKASADSSWPTPELPHRINQIYLEPILFAHAQGMARITILNRTDFQDFSEQDTGIRAVVRDLDSGEDTAITAAYIIGCDGGRSKVRQQIGSKLVGDPIVQRVQSSFIRAPDLLGRQTTTPCWGNFTVNPRRSGNVYAIDGKELWLVHNYLRDSEADFDSVDRDWAIREILGVGPDFKYEIINREDWFGRRLVADKFQRGRAFLCGDSAHLWVPYAGYGMNAGIADAENLAWLMAASLAGWGAPDLADAYVAERQPITEQVSVFAMNHSHAMAKERASIPAEIEDVGPAGDAARAVYGDTLNRLNVQQYCAGGLNFGYYYDASPIIVYDGEAPPPYTMQDFTTSTVPGCRTPHVWLADGRSLYDSCGLGFTLLRTDPTLDPEPILRAAAARKVPMALIDLDPTEEVRAFYKEGLLLSRPDHHVAWRGQGVPDRPEALVETVTGFGG